MVSEIFAQYFILNFIVFVCLTKLAVRDIFYPGVRRQETVIFFSGESDS